MQREGKEREGMEREGKEREGMEREGMERDDLAQREPGSSRGPGASAVAWRRCSTPDVGGRTWGCYGLSPE